MPNYRKVARKKARKYGLDPKTFQRQIKHESGYRQDVITGATASSAGAQGIAQIMPTTAEAWNVDPLKPKQALDAAAKHMAEYVKQYGSYRDALVAYNAGPGRVGMPLYAETAAYIARILGNSEGQTRLFEPEEVGARRPRDKPKDKPKAKPGKDLENALGEPSMGDKLALALGLVQDEIAPLDFAQQFASLPTQEATVPKKRKFPSDDAGAPGEHRRPGEKKNDPERGKRRDGVFQKGDGEYDGIHGRQLAILADNTDRFMRKHGIAGGSGYRSEASNAQAGGADDSDHLYDRGKRWARDYPTSGETGRQAAIKVARRYGIDDWDGEGSVTAMVKQGKRSFRVQILYGASVDHADHVHVGIRQIS